MIPASRASTACIKRRIASSIAIDINLSYRSLEICWHRKPAESVSVCNRNSVCDRKAKGEKKKKPPALSCPAHAHADAARMIENLMCYVEPAIMGRPVSEKRKGSQAAPRERFRWLKVKRTKNADLMPPAPLLCYVPYPQKETNPSLESKKSSRRACSQDAIIYQLIG